MAHEALDNQLEDILDTRGSLTEVLDSLARICAGKADHIRGNRQDRKLAGMWEAAATRISNLASSVEDPF